MLPWGLIPEKGREVAREWSEVPQGAPLGPNTRKGERSGSRVVRGAAGCSPGA